MLRLLQLRHPNHGRKVAIADNDNLRLLDELDSIYQLAQRAIAQSEPLEQVAVALSGPDRLDYTAVHNGTAEWKLCPAFDHPEEPARCMVTGTGLTHRASAQNRQAMHSLDQPAVVTDSMRMFELGLKGGRPAPGRIGVAPEWFYKGCGTILRGHGDELQVPAFALDGGEEAEVAGAYLIDSSGAPRRVGLMLANEFSDHRLEQVNYLYLAPSKLRTCAVGPELIIGAEFDELRGTVSIVRKGKAIWSAAFATGDNNMSHTLANLEHHHFKYPAHRRAGDVHIHFFGADVFSFGAGIELADGDVMQIELAKFGRPLWNTIRIDRSEPQLVSTKSI